MDAFATPSIRAVSPAKRWLSLLGMGAATLLLGLSFMSMPGAPATNLDGSWQEMLVNAHAQGLQFGRDVIFTWGPWGFLCTRYHLGATCALPIVLWQTLGQLLLAFCLVALTSRIPVWRRVLFYILLLTVQWVFQDIVYFVLITLAGVGGLMRKDSSLLRLCAWAVLLGFLAQLKFTYFAASGVVVVASSACWLGRKSKREPIVILAAYAIGVIAAWIGAGQNIDNLYPYVLRSLSISSGYGDAMGLDESWTTFSWGVALALFCLVFCWNVWRTSADRFQGRSAAGLMGFVFYVMWKESYTRADMVVLGGHVFGLFGLVAILAPALPGLLFPEKRHHWFDSSLPLCLAAIGAMEPDFYRQVLRVEWQRLYGSAVALGRVENLPADWEAQKEHVVPDAALPKISAAVGGGSVDVYNYPMGIALLNSLNISARPIFQSYSAYTPSLEGWNVRHYASSRAPDFLIWDDGRVDNRYPGEDDAMLLATLPATFSPVLQESGLWLFSHNKGSAAAQPGRVLLLKRSVKLGDPVELPKGKRQALWLQADPRPNGLGVARSLAYKPAEIDMVTTDPVNGERTWRIIPQVARAGFLLVPTLEHGSDLSALMQGDADVRVTHIRFEAPLEQREFWSGVDLNIFGMPSLPLSDVPFSSLQRDRIVDRRPISVQSAQVQSEIDVPEGKALFLHAPGSVVFSIPPGASRFSAGFGLRPGAYSEGGHTAGVRFLIEVSWNSGRKETLWSRYLDPVGNDADQGTQYAAVAIPREAPSRLEFKTLVGPSGDDRWCWSYVTGLSFEGAQAHE